jgi:hypothetical protein
MPSTSLSIAAASLGRGLPSGRPRRPWLFGAGALAALVAAVSVWAAWPSSSHGADIRDGTRLLDAQGFAARWGIQVKLLGLTADGGLVDFRYQVVDPDKANPLIHDRTLLPKFVNEQTGATIWLASLPHNHKRELKLGGRYFFLLANAKNALREGSTATLVLGHTRIEHLLVRR